jgi:hypothetical protein
MRRQNTSVRKIKRNGKRGKKENKNEEEERYWWHGVETPECPGGT